MTMEPRLKSCETKCTVTDCFILKYCPTGWYENIKDKITIGKYGKGQKVIFQGSPVHWICVIHSGKMKVYNESINGREVIFRLAKSGDILGYSAVGEKLIYSSSASAIEETTICFIPKKVFLDLITSNPDITSFIMMHLLEELRKSELRISNLALHSAKQRIAGVLLMMKEFAEKNSAGIHISLTRKEIADFAATSKEEASRAISSLKKEGILKIEKNENKIYIIKPEELNKLAQ